MSTKISSLAAQRVARMTTSGCSRWQIFRQNYISASVYLKVYDISVTLIFIAPLGSLSQWWFVAYHTGIDYLIPPSAAYMRQWNGSSLVQVMACRLFGAKPLPEPMLPYCLLNSWEQTPVKFKSEFYNFHSRKFIWKSRRPKWRGRWVIGGSDMDK